MTNDPSDSPRYAAVYPVTGVFAFAGLANGKYLLQETPGANQIRTGPFLTDALPRPTRRFSTWYARPPTSRRSLLGMTTAYQLRLHQATNEA